MLISAPAAAPAFPHVDADPRVILDDNLVPGLRLPKVPGLPGKDTPGIGLGDLLAPPKPDSLAGRADLSAVRGAQLLRTTKGDEWARRMDQQGGLKAWLDFAKRHRDATGKVQGWLDTALIAATWASTAAITQVAKERYDRPRPFVVDPKIVPPVRVPKSDSYPSGHASGAFAAARVISRLAPELSTEAYSLATQVAVSRVYAGVHFPTDVVAGALLGTGIAEAALRAAGKGPKAVEAAIAEAMAA